MAEEAWNQGLWDDFGAGCKYCCCPCLAGGAISAVDDYLGGVEVCGIGVGNLFCYVCGCEELTVRYARAEFRAKHNLKGSCIEDWCIADKCYGFGLAQMEAEVKFRTGADNDSGVVDMER